MRITPFLDIPIRMGTLDDAAADLVHASQQGEPLSVRLVNAGTLFAARRDPNYWDLLRTSGINYPDGRPLFWILGGQSRQEEQIRGNDLLALTMKLGAQQGTRHFLVGAREHTLERMVANLSSRWPECQFVGTFAPPFPPDRASRIALDEHIAATKPDIVWVGLGTPQQDRETQRLATAHAVVAVAVGAAFDFQAGDKRTAPLWLSTIGLEWLFRLIQEPRRLWRRYLLGNMIFGWLAVRHLVRRKGLAK